MLTALVTSVVFLASYLYFHFVVKGGQPTRFTVEGWPKAVYLSVLLTHTILAVVVAVMAPVTLLLGFGAPGNRHRGSLAGFCRYGYTSRSLASSCISCSIGSTRRPASLARMVEEEYFPCVELRMRWC